MPENKILSALKAPESENETRIEKIREGLKKLQHQFYKSEIKEIRKNLYEIENKKSFCTKRDSKISSRIRKKYL